MNHTTYNSFFKWKKTLEMTLFNLKMMVKSGQDLFYLEIEQAPLEILTCYLGCQANSAFLGRLFLHWAQAILKALIRMGRSENLLGQAVV